MQTRSPEVLANILERFNGTPIQIPTLSEYHKISLSLFSDRTKISNPRIQFTSQLDITEAYKNYQAHYKATPGATFTAYIKWITIKAMVNTPFNWRLVDNQWYEFNNLPLFIAIRTADNRSLITSFLFDVTHDKWESFCTKHSQAGRDQTSAEVHPDLYGAYFAVAYQMERLHIPRMTHYKTSEQVNDSHRPKVVFSDPYISEGRLYLPLYLSFSHASLIPKLAEQFLERFMTFAKKTPEAVQKEYQSMPAPAENNGRLSLRAKL